MSHLMQVQTPVARARRMAPTIAGLGVAIALMTTCAASAVVSKRIVATDPFTNATSQHATIVAADTFAYGSTIVAAAEAGRFRDGGASGIRYATSRDGAANWAARTLPAITAHTNDGGTFDRVSSPAVAYSARHGAWLISTIGIKSGVGTTVLTSRSTDGGQNFAAPVTTAPYVAGTSYDKSWIVCDNFAKLPTGAANPRYGNCYMTWTDAAQNFALVASTSTDGGLTWRPAIHAVSNGSSIGGQPVVQPNGNVIVPSYGRTSGGDRIVAFRSTDGGASWLGPHVISAVHNHTPAGKLRAPVMLSAEVDATGRVYIAWRDCGWYEKCTANDIVFSITTDGTNWAFTRRVPIAALGSGVDAFIPGLGVDPKTSGKTARLGLTYYYYTNAACTTACSLNVGYTQSNDSGATWTSPVHVAGPIALKNVPDTGDQKVIGDYLSTSWVGGRAYSALPIGRPRVATGLTQALEIPIGGLSSTGPGRPSEGPLS